MVLWFELKYDYMPCSSLLVAYNICQLFVVPFSHLGTCIFHTLLISVLFTFLVYSCYCCSRSSCSSKTECSIFLVPTILLQYKSYLHPMVVESTLPLYLLCDTNEFFSTNGVKWNPPVYCCLKFFWELDITSLISTISYFMCNVLSEYQQS